MSRVSRAFSGMGVVVPLVVVAADGVQAQESVPPFTLEQVEELVRGGVAPVRIRTLVENDCIDFPLEDESLARLRAAGATDEHLDALRGVCVSLPPSPPSPPTPTEPRTGFAFIGGGYQMDVGAEGVLGGPAVEIGGSSSGYGFRLRYHHLLTEQVRTSSRGIVSFDVLVGPMPGFYLFSGAHLLVQEGSEERIGGVTCGAGLSWRLEGAVTLGVEAAYVLRSPLSAASAPQGAQSSGFQGGAFIRILP